MNFQARQRGFTLIELLLATALIALIMAMAYGGFRASVRASTSGEALIEDTNRLRVVHEFMRSRIAQALPLIIEELDDAQIRFEGDRDRLRFIAPMPGYLSYGGPYVQEFRLERGTDGLDLVFAYAMLNGYEPGDLDVDPPVTLLENVGSIDIEYLGFGEDGEEVFWDTLWEDPARMPLAVSMRLDLVRENGLTFPDLDTPLLVDNSAVRQQTILREDISTPVGRHLRRQREQGNR